jgi:hypothetical protein
MEKCSPQCHIISSHLNPTRFSEIRPSGTHAIEWSTATFEVHESMKNPCADTAMNVLIFLSSALLLTSHIITPKVPNSKVIFDKSHILSSPGGSNVSCPQFMVLLFCSSRKLGTALTMSRPPYSPMPTPFSLSKEYPHHTCERRRSALSIEK